MKKSFISMSLVISIICMSSTYAAEDVKQQNQKSGTARFGENSICSWHSLGRGKLCEAVERELSVESCSQDCIIWSSDRKKMARISAEGKLIIGQQGWVVVKDALSKIIFDTEQRKSAGVVSLDEENSYGEIKLDPGSCVILFSYDNDKIDDALGMKGDDDFQNLKPTWNRILQVTYDRTIELESKADRFKGRFLLSHWLNSEQVGVAINDYGDIKRGRKEVLVEEPKEEIELLNSFFRSSEKMKKKLLGRLSITEHAVLLANLDKHGCDYSGDWDQLLRKKTIHCLEKEKYQNVSYLHKSKELIEETPQKAKRIIEAILQKISINIVQEISLSPNGMLAIVQYEGDKTKIIDLENGEVIFEMDEVKLRFFSVDGNLVRIEYKDGRRELVDMKGKVSFKLANKPICCPC